MASLNSNKSEFKQAYMGGFMVFRGWGTGWEITQRTLSHK